jgi:hypothetical protein
MTEVTDDVIKEERKLLIALAAALAVTDKARNALRAYYKRIGL